MADVLPILLAFPPEKSVTTPKSYDKAIHEYLKSLETIDETTYTQKVEKQNLLELLDPAVNSIAYLRTLVAQLEASSNDDHEHLDVLETRTLLFFATFDPVQIRYAGTDFLKLWRWLLNSVTQNDDTDMTSVVNALLRLDPTAGTLITPHLEVVRLCLARSVPSQALPILDKDVYALPARSQKGVPEELPSDEHELSNAWITEKSGFSLRMDTPQVLEYYLVGASIYMGLGIWHRARIFLEAVILSPSLSHTASALQVEAYKKWLMVGLIVQGKPYPEPKTHDPVVLKHLKTLSRMYDEFALDFELRNLKKLQADVETGWRDVQEDGNAGLVREMVDACMRYRIIDLQKTYAALPVTRMAKLLDIAPGDALQSLQRMMQEGHLPASLSGAGTDTVLRFHDTTSSESHSDLEAQTLRIQALVTQVRDADRRLQLTKEYVEHARRNAARGGFDSDPADAMDLTWDASSTMPNAADLDNDEDLMM